MRINPSCIESRTAEHGNWQASLAFQINRIDCCVGPHIDSYNSSCVRLAKPYVLDRCAPVGDTSCIAEQKPIDCECLCLNRAASRDEKIIFVELISRRICSTDHLVSVKIIARV